MLIVRRIVARFRNKLRRWFSRNSGMERVFTQDQRSISHTKHAAIAIQTPRPGQQHIGILHREDESSDVMLIHLAWHHELKNQLAWHHDPKNELLSRRYIWVDPPIHKSRLRQVAARCRQIWRANPNGIPYAFSPPNDCFDENSREFLLGPTKHGLTCSSFVLAVFEAAGLRLLNHNEWPTDRPGDREWQEWVLSELQNADTPTILEHLQAVQDEIRHRSVRIRPEEVAGAATVTPIPASFTTIIERATGILTRLATL